MKGSLALRNPVGTAIANDCSSTTITAAAYVQLTAATDAPASGILVFNTSAKAIKLARGASGSEVDTGIVIPPSSTSGTFIPIEIKKGTRLSAKALSADATTGYFVVTLMG